MTADDNNQQDRITPDGTVMESEGHISISEDVIVSLAASAASQVEGLGEKQSSVTQDIRRIFGNRRRGIEIELHQNSVDISVKIAVKQGYPVHEVARKAQEKIRDEVSSNTGLTVSRVDIYVQKLQLPDESSEVREELPPENTAE